MNICKSVENVCQLTCCQVRRLEVASVDSPFQYISTQSTNSEKARKIYQLTKYAVVLYPLVALSTTEFDKSRVASMDLEKVGTASERGERERRSKRLTVNPSMMAVETGLI